MNDSITPIFIYSLPRSGSTLLQRLLASHSQVSTASETWLLLPQIYALKKDGIYSEYQHHFSHMAINDFIGILPCGKDGYIRHLREFIKALYRDASSDNERYFVDKTPRYHLIVNDIIEMFPDAKHVFLWRNPLSIVASMIETWGGGNWNIFKYKVDLYKGLPNLIDAYEKNKDKVYSLRYEDLVTDVKSEISGLLEYLDLDPEDSVLKGELFSGLRGEMGDPTGVGLYSDVNVAGLEKWKSVLASPLRKRWCVKYIKKIGPAAWHSIGYDQDTMLRDISHLSLRLRITVRDLAHMPLGELYNIFMPHIILDKINKLFKKQTVYVDR